MFLKLNKIFVSAMLMLAFLITTCSASEYLFKLRDDVAVLCDATAELMTEECFSDDSLLSQKLGIYSTDDIAVIEKYRELGLLDYYEKNVPAELFDMPKTSEYTTSYSSSSVPIGSSLAQLGTDSFWELGLSGKNIVVGVVDSGVNEHTAIKGNLLPGCNTYDSTSNVTTDGHGHGTLVAGLIAANIQGYRGAAYNAKIVPIKAFSDAGQGGIESMSNGILAAVDTFDCDIINLSCGIHENYITDKENNVLKATVDYAIGKGAIIVAASGNVRSPVYGTATVGTEDSIMYPAGFDEVISVGNVDIDGNLHTTSIENEFVDVVANGKSVTLLSHTNLTGYCSSNGTSFSAPLVSGVVACMLQADSSLTRAEVEALLRETAVDRGEEGFDISYGYGIVNCTALVPKLLDGKIYESPFVKHKGAYNVAIRNGISDVPYVARLALASYSGGKMLGLKLKDVSLNYKDSTVISIGAGGSLTRLMKLNRETLAPLEKAKSTY